MNYIIQIDFASYYINSSMVIKITIDVSAKDSILATIRNAMTLETTLYLQDINEAITIIPSRLLADAIVSVYPEQPSVVVLPAEPRKKWYERFI